MTAAKVVFLVEVLVAALMVLGERSERTRMPYSKFRKEGTGVDTRSGMVAIYTLPMVVYAGLWLAAGAPSSPYHLIVLAAFLLHFAKRVIESLFVHTYSRPTPLPAFANIAVGYGATSAITSYFQNRAPPAPVDSLIFELGVAAFLLGELINGYHHWLLAGLRKKGEAAYRIPTRGLFAYIACPHYLGEIVTFLGMSLMANVLPTWGGFVMVVAYLSARAHSTLGWYQKALEAEVPARWRRLLPFVY